jgi:hypothetical protein
MSQRAPRGRRAAPKTESKKPPPQEPARSLIERNADEFWKQRGAKNAAKKPSAMECICAIFLNIDRTDEIWKRDEAVKHSALLDDGSTQFMSWKSVRYIFEIIFHSVWNGNRRRSAIGGQLGFGPRFTNCIPIGSFDSHFHRNSKFFSFHSEIGNSDRCDSLLFTTRPSKIRKSNLLPTRFFHAENEEEKAP